MKKFTIVLFMLVLCFCVSAVKAGDGWNYSIALSYVDGLDDLVDIYESNLESEGYTVTDVTEVPIGISFQPYYQYENGLQIAGGVGPIIYMYGDRDYFELPLHLSVGYSLFKDSAISPYVRGGLSYHAASGDYVDGSSAGFRAAVGVELLKSKVVSMGVEVAMDTAEVDIEDNVNGGIVGVKSAETTIGMFITF